MKQYAVALSLYRTKLGGSIELATSLGIYQAPNETQARKQALDHAQSQEFHREGYVIAGEPVILDITQKPKVKEAKE